MGEETQPLTDEIPVPPKGSHRRILTQMAVIVVVGSVAGFAFVSWKVGLGVLVGGVMAFANYYWQRHSIKAIFDRAVTGTNVRFLAARYVLRYVVLGLAMALIYLSGFVSIYAVIFGLASFSLAVVIEGFTSIFSSPIKKEL
jgi:hypothetical protein